MKKIQIGKINNQFKIINLKKIKNLKGNIQLIKKYKKNSLKNISEIYSLWINKNQIKGWNFHKKMTVNLIILVGKVKFVIYNPKNYSFKSYIINEKKPQMIVIPPKRYFGIKNLYKSKSLLLNIANLKHNKNEYTKTPLNKIKYSW